MGFASGAVTFKRFFVSGDIIRQADQGLLDALAARSMNGGNMRLKDGTDVGWTTGQHILDTRFDFEKNVIADGLLFAIRIDTNKPPADLIRSYQRLAEEAMLEASGREFLTKAERREAREQALARADSEARSGAFRKMAATPAFWDLKRNEVYLGSASPKVVDQFNILFRETFDRTLTAASSGEIASRWSGLAGETRVFDDCEPAHLVSPPDGASTSEDFAVPDASRKDFLGTEWLTWLWYATQVESPEITTGLSESVAVVFEKSLALECPFKISGKTAITADAPTGLPEAGAALAGGKRPVRVGLQLGARGSAFGLALRGDLMHFSGVQLPPPEDASNPRAVFEDRIQHLRDLIDVVGDLYSAFLKRRLSNKWPQTLSAMRVWVASGAHEEMTEAPVAVA